MATPAESTTTVSGRRCTRSRARTAATSSITSTAAEVVSPTELTSTTTSEAPQIQSSAVDPSPAAPPASTEQAPDVASSAAPPASSAPGTDSPASSVAQTSPLANLQPTPPAAVVPDPGVEVSETEAAVEASVAVDALPTSTPTPSAISSDTIAPAPTPSPSDSTSPPESSVDAQPEPSSVAIIPFPSEQPSNGQPEQPQSTGVSPGGSAGIITPGQPGSDQGSLTIANDGQTNVGGIVGGVVGGFVGIALISALLFLCLRKRRAREPFARWQQRLSEKSSGEGSLAAKLKAIPEKLAVIPRKIQAIPANIGLIFSKMKGKKSGSAENPYRRHSVRSSVSSVYSVRSNGRSRSISEPPSKFRDQLRNFGGRMPSLKKSRALLQKKPDSFVNGSKSPFKGIVDDPVLRNSKGIDNPFVDPKPPGTLKTLFALNPDPVSREGTPKPQRGPLDGLRDQQRPPMTPKPVAMSDRGSRDPFASILDELEERNGSGTPEWLKDDSHKRTHSLQTALRSHPPSTYTASIYTTADNPFFDPSDAPPVPTQPLPPNPPARPTNTYTATLPSFNMTSSNISRESNGSFLFGEPGPSRPTTNMFSDVSVIPPPRTGRQSDPFDLDRPEVLGFGEVNGRHVRASVTRQNSKNRRRSSIPNWISIVDDNPYERASAVPGPLRNPSVKR
ncbi:hypothetical protein EJ04DRAFT_540713 [Polyplosphaeria fusca]|uniref:Uncharacterized protein n=1 Tax=Polyplosphaeria fusca TaxID=682080 RepID=A0A9P4RAJ6_9PLEO|nr:hypothetical protein EJ04DRAFT_540713 [Polyplosphaeria fusca]